MKRHPEPLWNRVLVKLKQTEKKSAGGIIIETDVQASKSRYATQEAYIVELGAQAFKETGTHPPVEPGDLVKIVKYSGENDTTVEDGEIYQIVNDVDVISKLRGEGLND